MHHVLKQLAVGTVAALACACAARAGEAIVTDRPDFVESSDVVGRGHVQIETGLSFERSQSAGVKSRTTTTPTLLRLGVNEAIELRVETDGFVRSSVEDASGTQRERGFSDVALGVKWHVQEGDEASGKPGLAWLLHLDVDSGSPAFRGQGLRPSLRGVAEWDLPQNFSVGVMPGVLIDKNADGKRFASGILAVTLGNDFAPGWHGFVELAGQQLASKRNGGSVVTFDFGASHLLSDSVQVDIAASRGLTSDSPDFQWGVGLSLRF